MDHGGRQPDVSGAVGLCDRRVELQRGGRRARRERVELNAAVWSVT